MLANLGHGVANIWIRKQQVVVLLCFPIGESGEFLRNCLEQTNDDSDRDILHVIAELLHSSRILPRCQYFNLSKQCLIATHRCAVMAVELHFFPHCQ